MTSQEYNEVKWENAHPYDQLNNSQYLGKSEQQKFVEDMERDEMCEGEE